MYVDILVSIVQATIDHASGNQLFTAQNRIKPPRDSVNFMAIVDIEYTHLKRRKSQKSPGFDRHDQPIKMPLIVKETCDR